MLRARGRAESHWSGVHLYDKEGVLKLAIIPDNGMIQTLTSVGPQDRSRP